MLCFLLSCVSFAQEGALIRCMHVPDSNDVYSWNMYDVQVDAKNGQVQVSPSFGQCSPELLCLNFTGKADMSEWEREGTFSVGQRERHFGIVTHSKSLSLNLQTGVGKISAKKGLLKEDLRLFRCELL